jgi:hypothetical protein
MKRKTCLTLLLGITFGLVVYPAAGLSQNIGFRVGIAPPPLGFPPVQAPAIAVSNPFTPIQPIGIPSSPFISPTPLVPLVPTFPTVLVPNTVLVPGQTILPQPFVAPVGPLVGPVFTTPVAPVITPGPLILVPTSGVQPMLGVQPVLPATLPGRHFPLIGTPRADVLRLYGQPSVTVITSSGETLYFTGGVTVIIQNGQVVGPR